MPNLTLTVTDAQRDRIREALAARYANTPLASASLADQASDFIFKMLDDMVLGFERAKAAKQAEATLTGL